MPLEFKTRNAGAGSTARFFLFSPGVTNFLMERKSISAKTPEFGPVFGLLLRGEIKANLEKHGMHGCRFHEPSTSQYEVGFIDPRQICGLDCNLK